MNEIPQLSEAFAQVLQEAREEARVSQHELARRVNCARSFISFLETRTHLPSLNAFLVLCSALDLPAAEVLRRLENRLAFLQQAAEAEKQANAPGGEGPAMR
ncbi:MAG: helix-turn-helix domain-containing protein [Desulfovibrio sp.]|nr:helix-turn-helix domain-containing protein [Desulfovibrio sp.]